MTYRYSTIERHGLVANDDLFIFREFNNAMNSFKSASSFAKTTPVSFHQLKQDIEPLLRSQISVELRVGLLGIFKTSEHLRDSLHKTTLARPPSPEVRARRAVPMT